MSIRPAPAILALLLSLSCTAALAQQNPPKAVIALVGDVDRFTIGQEGFCGQRNEITSPSGKQFRIPSDKKTFFYIQSRIHGNMITYTCEGDYSFTPEPGMLHIVRYSMSADRCKLEMFESRPGEEPVPAAVQREESQNCLFK